MEEEERRLRAGTDGRSQCLTREQQTTSWLPGNGSGRIGATIEHRHFPQCSARTLFMNHVLPPVAPHHPDPPFEHDQQSGWNRSSSEEKLAGGKPPLDRAVSQVGEKIR